MQKNKKISSVGKKCLLALLMLLTVFSSLFMFSFAADPPAEDEAPKNFFVYSNDAKKKEVGFIMAEGDGYTTYFYSKKYYDKYKTNNNSTASNQSWCSSSWSKGVVHMVYYAEGGLFNSLTSKNDAFKINSFDGDDTSDLWKVFWNIYDALAAVGAGLALMWVLLDLIEASSNSMLNGEFVVKMFIKFILAVFIIDYGKNLIKSLLAISNGFYDIIAERINLGTNGAELFFSDTLTTIVTSNFMECLSILLEYVIVALAMLVCFVLAVSMIVGRIFELGVRTAFAPIGIADLMIHGTNSAGMRFAKSYLACASQGAAMILILSAGSKLMTGDGLLNFFGKTTALGGVLGGISFILAPLIAITTIGVMKRADSILQSVFS